MREKLIQILETYNGDPYNNPERSIVDHLLASIACDNCRHWDPPNLVESLGAVYFAQCEIQDGTWGKREFCSSWAPK